MNQTRMIRNNPTVIADRRARVASLLAKRKTEREIAAEMGISQPTVNRTIRELRDASNEFIYNLAKADLSFFYNQTITGVDDAIREIWAMLENPDNPEIDMKRLSALKLIIEANKTKFELLNNGPSIMAMRSLNERLERIEQVENTAISQ